MNLDKIIEGGKTIGISGHISPDGDCIGSSLALYNYIQTYYPEKKVDVYLEFFPKKFMMLKGADKIKHVIPKRKVYDVYFSMDCGSLDRLGFALKYFRNAKVQACIDHHISNAAQGPTTYVVPTASATCELVYELTCHRKITLEMAECLYLGIAHDTGVFQFSNTSPRTMEIAGKLLEVGVKGHEIIENTYYEKTFIQIKMLALGLKKVKLLEEGKVVTTFITLDEMKSLGCTKGDTEGIVSQLRNIKGVNVAIFLYEQKKGCYKVSLRSNDTIDSSEVAVNFGGGGHKKAAGFSIEGSPEVVLKKVLEEIKKQF